MSKASIRICGDLKTYFRDELEIKQSILVDENSEDTDNAPADNSSADTTVADANRERELIPAA
jgi:hypothetical protein